MKKFGIQIFAGEPLLAGFIPPEYFFMTPKVINMPLQTLFTSRNERQSCRLLQGIKLGS
jgi:hypothetical protein